MPSNSEVPEKKEEFKAFLFITVILFPALSVFVVVALGFAIWISQMLLGPPTS